MFETLITFKILHYVDIAPIPVDFIERDVEI